MYFWKRRRRRTNSVKLPPHTTDFSAEKADASKESLSKLDDFWRIYDQVEAEQHDSPGSTISVDKNTVGGEDLRSRLLSSGRFYQSDAAIMIQGMVKEGYLEDVSFDTYRKKKQGLEKLIMKKSTAKDCVCLTACVITASFVLHSTIHSVSIISAWYSSYKHALTYRTGRPFYYISYTPNGLRSIADKYRHRSSEVP